MALRVSERASKANKAKARLEVMIFDEAIKAGLTRLELLQTLASCQQGILKDMLRAERHPENPDEPADLE